VVARQDTSAARVHLETLTSCSLSKAEVPVFRQQHLVSADSHVIASPQMLGLPNLSDVWRVLKEADLNKLRREAECPFQVLSAGPLGSLLQSAVPRLESSGRSNEDSSKDWDQDDPDLWCLQSTRYEPPAEPRNCAISPDFVPLTVFYCCTTVLLQYEIRVATRSSTLPRVAGSYVGTTLPAPEPTPQPELGLMQASQTAGAHC
jgi:hypothetical protein